MATLTTIKDENRLLVSAGSLYAAMGKKTKGAESEKEALLCWLADRILSFDLEAEFDFFIYLNAESVREMIRYESAPREVTQFFENYKQYIENHKQYES